MTIFRYYINSLKINVNCKRKLNHFLIEGSDEVPVRVNVAIGLCGRVAELHVAAEWESRAGHAAGGELPHNGLGQAATVARLEESGPAGQRHATALLDYLQERRRPATGHAHPPGHPHHGQHLVERR